MRLRITRFVESSAFENFITGLIVFNFFTIYASTEGYNMEAVETGILLLFTVEVFLKLYAWGFRQWSREGWNWFDAIIVTLGLLPLLGVPLPKGFAAVRSLRLIRLLGRIPSTRALISAIIKSSGQLGGVVLLSGLFLMIFTLMATQTFQDELPELFANFGTSFTTLLGMAAFSGLTDIGQAWAVSKFGTLLVFPGFILTVPLTALNLVIAVLSKALDRVEEIDEEEVAEETLPRQDEIAFAIQQDIEKIQQSISQLRQDIIKT